MWVVNNTRNHYTDRVVPISFEWLEGKWFVGDIASVAICEVCLLDVLYFITKISNSTAESFTHYYLLYAMIYKCELLHIALHMNRGRHLVSLWESC